MALVILARILLKVFGVFIDGVVREMHKQIVQVVAHRRYIFWRRKASETFIVDEDTQRCNTRDKNVYSEIKFQTIYHVGLV